MDNDFKRWKEIERLVVVAETKIISIKVTNCSEHQVPSTSTHFFYQSQWTYRSSRFVLSFERLNENGQDCVDWKAQKRCGTNLDIQDRQPTSDQLSNRQTVRREAGSRRCPIVSLVAWLEVDKRTYSCWFDVCVSMQTKIMRNNVNCRDWKTCGIPTGTCRNPTSTCRNPTRTCGNLKSYKHLWKF